MMRRAWRVIAVALLLGTVELPADERILDFRSEVRIGSDGSLDVTETLRVRSEGRNIRQGIYRDFPTDYRDRLGNRFRAGFQVLSARRDGAPESFHTARRANGVRVYLGREGVFLPEGEHAYELRYRTTRQVGFFADFDELYWNVTGTGWGFPIDRAVARFQLPGPVPADRLKTAFYTGPQGATGQQARVRVDSGGRVHFQTTAPLAPGEGLTVAVGWPKGLVAAPSAARRVRWFLADNGGALAMLLGLLAPLAWYLWAWRRVGRDPRGGVIIPRFEPPAGLSPAACSYVLAMSLRRQAFTAAVISLGVKGYLEIDQDDDDFTLHRKAASGTGASPGESAVLEALLPGQAGSIALEHDNHRAFQAALAGLKSALGREYQGRLFKLNGVYALPPVLASLVAAVAAAGLSASPLQWVVYAFLAVTLHVTFLMLLRAPTPGGRQVMDEIEGFRMYLDTAEADRLERMRSPALTPELFEAFLPFAFALGVENAWCRRFEEELPRDGEADGDYRPDWYRGRRRRTRALDRIGNRLSGELSGAIASASSPPGSSSGSGGGGSSGGGGGGGGGGGW